MQTQATCKAVAPRGFTLIELLVVITIILLLAAFVVPAARKVLDRSRAAKCQSNLRQIAGAVLYYANEHDGKMPVLSNDPDDDHHWQYQFRQYQLLGDYLEPFENYRCPSATSVNAGDNPAWENIYCDDSIGFCTDYKINDNVRFTGVNAFTFADTSWVVVAADIDWGWPAEDHARHDGGEHYAFLAGHVMWFSREDALLTPDPYGNTPWDYWGLENQ